MGVGVNTAWQISSAGTRVPGPSVRALERGSRPLGRFARLSIRNKLLAMVLLPLLGVLPLLGAFLLWWGSAALDQLLLTKVRSDLAVAQGYFERVLGEVGSSATGIAESAALQQALQQGGPPTGKSRAPTTPSNPAAEPPPDAHALARAQALLDALARRERLDFIRLLPHGQLPDRTATTSLEVLTPHEQVLLGPALRQRVPVPLLPTRNAAPTGRTVEDRALVLLAKRPVLGAQGQLLAHLQTGVLLNRNLALIDHINEIVYPAGSLPFARWGSRGTATLFLDDVRISTNVRLFGAERDERAIGTRASHTVRDSVLGQGTTWLDRAFVVNDWYVSAYQPLASSDGQNVGMLYVGILERPFTLLKYGALASVGVLFFAVMLVAAVVSLRWAQGIFKPLEQMEATMQRVEHGALEARVGTVASGDEIGRLAGHLDRLLAAIDSNTRHLDAQVAERTRALEHAQQQLVHSEKMATVGQLAASIAHEVNNPIAVMQGNLDLLRELVGPEGTARIAPELKLMDEQVERMRLIVTRLLQFSRPGEYAGYVEPVDTHQVFEDCLVLAAHQLARTCVTVRRSYQATRLPSVNRQELQQVLVNLIVNGMHAMPEGGTLCLSACDIGGPGEAPAPEGWQGPGVALEVADTGRGLSDELLGQLFQPFVTRRREGTGLGLWISRSLVQRYGGDIRAANRASSSSIPEAGAVFTVLLKTANSA
jgi:two-component system, NtrC family, sensor kinase